MGFYDKIISIKDGKANTIHNTSGEGVSISGVSFLAMSIYCKDTLQRLTTLGQKGFKTYGFGVSFPFTGTTTDNETIETNKFGYGSISNFLKTGNEDEWDSIRKYYFPLCPISANCNMQDDAIEEHASNLETETLAAYNYTYIIDFDSELVRLITSVDNKGNIEYIDIPFLELDICKNNVNNEIKLLKRVLRRKITDEIIDNYFEQREHIIKCGADDIKNFKEIVLNSTYIFNNTHNAMEIKELLEDFLK